MLRATPFSACATIVLLLNSASAAELTVNGGFETGDFSGWERVLTQARVHWLYASLIVWPAPSRLNLEHDFSVSRSPFEPVTFIAVAAWALVAIGVLWLARRRPRYGFPLLFFVPMAVLILFR